MPNADMKRFAPRDVLIATALLTRLPVKLADEEFSRGALAAWAYPIAGLVAAFCAALAGAIALWLGVPVNIAAIIVIAVQVVVTGAMHEDGLADVADGFWGGWTVERRLEIMKDSHIGTYGVLALGFSLLARFVALSYLMTLGQLWGVLLVAAATSRVPMVALMHWHDNARGNGLSHSVGRPPKEVFGGALIAGLGVALFCAPWAAIMLFVVLALLTLGCSKIAMNKIGGQTGDVLGATQQISEIAALVVMASLAA